MDRRNFIRTTVGSLLGTRSLTSVFGQLALMEASSALSGPVFPDYRALVCVFMLGGNDGFNTIVPMSGGARAAYESSRATLALPVSQLLPLTPAADGGASDGCSYGVQSCLSAQDTVGAEGLRTLFDTGRAAVVCNVGALIQPTTKEDYQTKGFPLPPQLFSHNDQQTYWQTCGGAGDIGWGGRMADLLHAANENMAVPFSISASGQATLLRSNTTSPYVVGSNHLDAMEFIDGSGHGSTRVAFEQLIAQGGQSHALASEYANTARRTRETYALMSEALAAAPPLATEFPSSPLGRQLRMVARLISARQSLGLKRQIFYVEAGGFDTHDSQLIDHPGLLSDLSQSMHALYLATQELNVSNNVTTFTSSDFGRTLSSNGDGSDHGWGSHHIVLGGAVRGQRFFGDMPDLTAGGALDAGWGQIIPTSSIEQLAGTLGKWLGLTDSNVAQIFPNIVNFQLRDLGFMA